MPLGRTHIILIMLIVVMYGIAHLLIFSKSQLSENSTAQHVDLSDLIRKSLMLSKVSVVYSAVTSYFTFSTMNRNLSLAVVARDVNVR